MAETVAERIATMRAQTKVAASKRSVDPRRGRWQSILQQAAALRALADNLVNMVKAEVDMQDDLAADAAVTANCPTNHANAVDVTGMGDEGTRMLCPDCGATITR